jgi:hypothetical protein
MGNARGMIDGAIMIDGAMGNARGMTWLHLHRRG